MGLVIATQRGRERKWRRECIPGGCILSKIGTHYIKMSPFVPKWVVCQPELQRFCSDASTSSANTDPFRKGVMGNAPNYRLMLNVALIYPTKHLWALASVVKSPQEGQRTVNNLYVGPLNSSMDTSYFQSPHGPTVLGPSSQVKLRTLFSLEPHDNTIIHATIYPSVLPLVWVGWRLQHR